MLKILHQMTNQQHGESSSIYHSTAKSMFEKWKQREKNKVQGFGKMIKNFVKFSSADNFQDTEIIWSQKIFQILLFRLY